MKKFWTESEIAALRQAWKSDQPVREFAEKIGRSTRSVYLKAHKIRLPKKADPKKFRLSQNDSLWLRINFPHMRNELCAMKLGISVRSVVRIARDLCIEKTPQFMEECNAYMSHKMKGNNFANHD